MLLPGVIFLIFLRYLPMFGTFIAFKEIDYALGFWDSPWIGFKNFEFLFATKDALIAIRNTLFYNIIFIVTNPIISVILAIMIYEVGNRKIRKVYQTLLIMPYFISMVVVSYLVYAFLDPNLGYLKSTFNIDIMWYQSPEYWPVILFFVNGWKVWGWGTVIYLATMSGFPPDLYEAASIDGATRLQQIRKITIPLLTPIIIMLFILSLGSIFFSDFGLFYQVPRASGALIPTTQTLDTYTYRALLQLGDTGMASAAALFQSVVGFIMVFSANIIIKRVAPERALF